MKGLCKRTANGVLAVLCGLALPGMNGCVTHYGDIDAFVITPKQSHSLKPYVIEPPDVVRIIAPNAPEIHNDQQVIRPDGYITLHLVGDQLASEKTPTQLAMEIQEKIGEFYEDVKVQVRVTAFNSKFYYMAGETRAGPRPYTGNNTVFDAVMRTGLPPTSWPSKAALIRPNEDGNLIRRMSVDLKAMQETGDFTRNAVLEEGDIVFIPINPLAAVGRAIRNLLSPVDPAIRVVTTPARVTSTGTGF